MMARLIYASNMSLDGCTEDERGALDWGPPDDEVFAFITELMRSACTYLNGRRMYDAMAVWETDSTLAAQSELTADFWPVILGGRTPALPTDTRADLELSTTDSPTASYSSGIEFCDEARH